MDRRSLAIAVLLSFAFASPAHAWWFGKAQRAAKITKEEARLVANAKKLAKAQQAQIRAQRIAVTSSIAGGRGPTPGASSASSQRSTPMSLFQQRFFARAPISTTSIYQRLSVPKVPLLAELGGVHLQKQTSTINRVLLRRAPNGSAPVYTFSSGMRSSGGDSGAPEPRVFAFATLR